MTQIATVEKILPGGFVEISVPRKSACGHDCEECAGCGMTGAAIHARAKDPVGVRPGQKVVVESATRKILGVVALVYLLPVVGFLLGYFLSEGLAEGVRRLLRDYLKKVPQKVDHIDPADFAEKMCGLQFTFADISEAHDAIGLTATSEVIITIPQRDGTRLDYELDGKTAFIDQSLVAENQIGRLNFTMMHEAAHQLFWMLYPEEYEVQTPRCVFRMADEHTQYPVLDWEEWQTNVLTSFLLLPKELVYRHMADVGLKDGIGVLNRIYARKDYECFSEAAKRLGVSKTALAIRSSQLGLVGRNDLYDPYALVDIFPEKNEIA